MKNYAQIGSKRKLRSEEAAGIIATKLEPVERDCVRLGDEEVVARLMRRLYSTQLVSKILMLWPIKNIHQC